jgi:hypothetical protein
MVRHAMLVEWVSFVPKLTYLARRCECDRDASRILLQDIFAEATPNIKNRPTNWSGTPRLWNGARSSPNSRLFPGIPPTLPPEKSWPQRDVCELGHSQVSFSLARVVQYVVLRHNMHAKKGEKENRLCRYTQRVQHERDGQPNVRSRQPDIHRQTDGQTDILHRGTRRCLCGGYPPKAASDSPSSAWIKSTDRHHPCLDCCLRLCPCHGRCQWVPYPCGKARVAASTQAFSSPG